MKQTEQCAVHHKGLRNMTHGCLGCHSGLTEAETEKRKQRGYNCVREQYEQWHESIAEAEELYINVIMMGALKESMLAFYAQSNMESQMHNNNTVYSKLFNKFVMEFDELKSLMQTCISNLENVILPRIRELYQEQAKGLLMNRLQMLHHYYRNIFTKKPLDHLIEYYDTLLRSVHGSNEALKQKIPLLKKEIRLSKEKDCLKCMIASLQYHWHAMEWTWWELYECGYNNGPMPIIENCTLIDHTLWVEGARFRNIKCNTELKECTPIRPYTFVDYVKTSNHRSPLKNKLNPAPISNGPKPRNTETEIMIPYERGPSEFYVFLSDDSTT